MKTMFCHICRMYHIVYIFCTMWGIISVDVFADEFTPSYVVQKTNSQVIIDGRLDEKCWSQAPKIEFLEIVDGTRPPWQCYGKMLWDYNYFYFGFNVENPNIWATLDPSLPEPTAWPEQHDEFIMHNDGFAKIFFDPDGDGKTYAELHINALNKVDDWYFVYPHHWVIGVNEFHKQPDNWHLEWDFKGLKSAIFIDGTINNPQDIDKSWSLEVAIPWDSIKPITLGNCPPKSGDIWRAHIGRVYCNAPKSRHTYYTWPVIGIRDCHRNYKWGYILFADEFKDIIYK